MRVLGKPGHSLWEAVYSAFLMHEKMRSSIPLPFVECTCRQTMPLSAQPLKDVVYSEIPEP